MDNKKYLDLISKYLSGNISGTEREELLDWADSAKSNRSFFDEMVQLWGLSGDYEAEPLEVDTEAAWNRLEPRLDEGASGRSGGIIRSLLFSKISWGVAAAIAIMIMVFSWGDQLLSDLLKPAIVDVFSPDNEQLEFYLPDSTLVILNQKSMLSYRKKFKERNVTLEGEAYFDVTQKGGQAFTIYSGSVKTTVVGTAFNVRAYAEDDEIQVTVEEGRVEVEARGDESTGRAATKVALKPGQSAVFNRTSRQLQEKTEAVNNAFAWKQKKLDFFENEMTQVIDAVERYFDITINFEKRQLLTCPFTYTADDPTEADVINVIKAYLNINEVIHNQEEGTYLFIGGDCDM